MEDKVYQFFDSSICEKTGILRSEDFTFCDMWRKQGGKIYAAQWVKLKHIGTHVFG